MELFRDGIQGKVLMNIQCSSVEECKQLLQTYVKMLFNRDCGKSFPELVEEGAALIHWMAGQRNSGFRRAGGWKRRPVERRALNWQSWTNPEHLKPGVPSRRFITGGF